MLRWAPDYRLPTKCRENSGSPGSDLIINDIFFLFEKVKTSPEHNGRDRERLVQGGDPDPQDSAHQRPHLGREQLRTLKVHLMMVIQVYLFGSDRTSSLDLRCRSEDKYLPVVGLSWWGTS